MKQTANISPLINSTSALTGIPQQLNRMTQQSNELPTKEDVDDDSMPLEEAEAMMLDGLSDIELSSPLNSSTSDEPVFVRDKIQPRRLAYSVTAESALTPRPTTIRPNLAKVKQSSEKKVNFLIDSVPSGSSPVKENEVHVGDMITEVIQKAKEQCENEVTTPVDGTIQESTMVDISDQPTTIADTTPAKGDSTESKGDSTESKGDSIESQGETDAKSAETDDHNQNSVGTEGNDHSILVQSGRYQSDDNNIDNQSPHPPSSPQTTSGNNGSDHLTTDAATHTPRIDVVQQPTIISPTTSKVKSTLLVKKPSSTAPCKPTQARKPIRTTSVTIDSQNIKKSNSKQTNKAKQNTTSKGGKQPSSKKPSKMDNDWKKTILQNVKK